MNLHALENVEMDKQGRALVGITRARETLSREDAVIASGLAARNVGAPDVRHVSDLVANRGLLYEFNLAILPADDRELFEQYWKGPESKALRDAEERFVAAGAGKNPRSVTAAQWDEAAGKVLDDLATMGTAAGDRYQKRVKPVAMGVLVQAAVAGILGFIALAVSLVLSVRIGRDLIRDLSRLRKDAHEASGVRLPSVMRRLAAGETVDVETEAPASNSRRTRSARSPWPSTASSAPPSRPPSSRPSCAAASPRCSSTSPAATRCSCTAS